MSTYQADDGTIRQDHYGTGRQPWDDIVDQGWAPEFAAGNILKYLRRTKDPEHSAESARWYWLRLIELMVRHPPPGAVDPDRRSRAGQVVDGLFSLLTKPELALLRQASRGNATNTATRPSITVSLKIEGTDP
jgi:hypothetical protein